MPLGVFGSIDPIRCGARPKSNRAGKLLIGHEPVDRWSTEARHLHDRWHVQEHDRYLIVCIGW
jgi:hypothetical protein